MQTKLVSPYYLLCPHSMDVYLYCLRTHQLDATIRIQVAQTCLKDSILAHVLIQRSFKEINQLDTSVMGAISKRFEAVLSSHGGTQQ